MGAQGRAMKAMRLLLLGLLPHAIPAAPPSAEPAAGAEKCYDLVVVEATPGGIAMAVRAAREGLSVLLANHNGHLGGILSSGLGVWDTQFEGKRSPIYDEVRQSLFAYYRTAYGENSPQYQDALPGKTGYTNGRFEPRAAEKILTELVARESGITALKGFHPIAARREGRLIQSVTFRESAGNRTVRVAAKVFADCTYEGRPGPEPTGKSRGRGRGRRRRGDHGGGVRRDVAQGPKDAGHRARRHRLARTRHGAPLFAASLKEI